MTSKQSRVLLISGSTRARSTNSSLVRTALVCAPDGVATARYGMTGLPYFNPDDDRDPLPPSVVALRGAITAADALLFCTPEYAGSLPGAFKNLLEWTVGDTVLNDKPVAWVNAAADPNRGHGAHTELRTVLGYVGAHVVDDACRSIPVPLDIVGTDGLIDDVATRDAITEVLRVLATAAAPSRT